LHRGRPSRRFDSGHARLAGGLPQAARGLGFGAMESAIIPPMEFSIREAEAGEEEQVLAMYEWLFKPPGSTAPQWDPDKARPRLSDAIASPRAAVLVAAARGGMIAFCAVYLELDSVRFGQRCWVEDFAADPEQRFKGVGRPCCTRSRSGRGELEQATSNSIPGLRAATRIASTSARAGSASPTPSAGSYDNAGHGLATLLTAFAERSRSATPGAGDRRPRSVAEGVR